MEGELCGFIDFTALPHEEPETAAVPVSTTAHNTLFLPIMQIISLGYCPNLSAFSQ